MNLIRTILGRLSDSFFLSVPDRFSTEALSPPSLRLVSDKPTIAAETPSRRAPAQAGSQLDAIEDAVRRSQAWFCPGSRRKVIGSPSSKPIPP